MKKTITMILALLLCVSLLAACGASPTPAETKPVEAEPAENEAATPAAAAPAASELVENFFKPVAEIPTGTAGSTLKMAQVACGVLRFADSCAIRSADPEELRGNLAEAWASLSADEQAAFEEKILAVQGLIANAAATWEDYSGLFEDAGVKEDMEALRESEEALESFTCLYDGAVAACREG